MTHGFDDQGRQFDAKGNLRDWWTAEDAARYKERASKVADQFASYTVLDTVHLNGQLTLGENIADLGGLALAYAALQKELAGKPRPAKLDGFTPEQRFFLAYAQIWRRLHAARGAAHAVNTDPHSPGHWRVNGPLSNLDEFAKAFGCKEGDPDGAQGGGARAHLVAPPRHRITRPAARRRRPPSSSRAGGPHATWMLPSRSASSLACRPPWPLRPATGRARTWTRRVRPAVTSTGTRVAAGSTTPRCRRDTGATARSTCSHEHNEAVLRALLERDAAKPTAEGRARRRRSATTTPPASIRVAAERAGFTPLRAASAGH